MCGGVGVRWGQCVAVWCWRFVRWWQCVVGCRLFAVVLVSGWAVLVCGRVASVCGGVVQVSSGARVWSVALVCGEIGAW